MEGLTNIFQSITKLPADYSARMLATMVEHQSFSKPISVVDPVLTYISTSLTSPSAKNDGLLVLNLFVHQCSLEILEEKISQWIQATIRATTYRGAVETVKLGFVVLTKLITRSKLIPEATKNVANNHIVKIIDTLVNSPAQTRIEALDCMAECMKVYAGPCGVHKAQIEAFLMSQIDAGDENVVRSVGRCLLLLQQTRGGGTQGSLHKTAWAELQDKLLGSLHKCLDQLYANVTETYDAHTNDNFESLKLVDLKLSSEPVTRLAQLQLRFSNLVGILEAVLVGPYPVSKFLQPMKIFRLIFRGLAINCTTLAKNSIMDNVALGALLPAIHIKLLSLLNTMILTLCGNCILYSNGICDVLVGCLKWTASGKSKGFTKPYIGLRKATYTTIGLLCRTLKYGSQVETLAEPLIEQILHDILPYQGEITLKIQSAGGNLTKKAKKKLRKQQNDSSTLSLAHSTSGSQALTSKRFQEADAGNDTLCAAALSTLCTIFECCGCMIKPVLHRLLHETVVAQCFTIAATSPKSKLGVYASLECRRQLYAVLLGLVNNPHHLCAPPLQYAAVIFGMAQTNDPSPEVRAATAAYSRSLEKVLHPQKATYYFDADTNDVKTAMRTMRALKEKILEQSDSDSESESDDQVEEQAEEEPAPMVEDAVDSPPAVLTKSISVESSSADESEDEVSEVVEPSVTNKTPESPPQQPASVTATVTIEESDDEMVISKPTPPTVVPSKRQLSPNAADESVVVESDSKKQKLSNTRSDVIDILTDDEDGANERDLDEVVDEMVASFVDEPSEEVMG